MGIAHSVRIKKGKERIGIRSQGETSGGSTLMIPEISTRNLKISATSKPCDLSA